jgi:HD-GYP domain-containing protein (c-di-GMP phosphodiesterase class II)
MFFGWLYLDNRTGSATESPAKEVAGFAKAVASMLGLALSNIQRSQMQQRFDDEKKLMVDGTMRALIEAIDAKDPYTRGHSDRVSKFAMLLARAAKLSEGEIKQAGDGGLLHDIGKIGVSEKILCKPTHLDPEEFAQIQEHPRLGYKILKDIPQVRDLLLGMLQHHERWDGSGYPDKLKGEKISQLGRILCIADCFDAMTSARFYRPARSISEVRAEIKRCLGTHFDPKLGEIFLSIPESELLPLISTALQPAAQ